MAAFPFSDPPQSPVVVRDPDDERHRGASIVPASDADEYEPEVVAARRPAAPAARGRRLHLLPGEE